MEENNIKGTVKNEFSKKISRCKESKAYLAMCEEVYGYRIPLFNMMDKEQIDLLLKKIKMDENDVVVDLGCGSGSILKLLVENRKCNGVGIDLLDANLVDCAVENKQIDCATGNMQYICGDMDCFTELSLKPTITLAIDSLYFRVDLASLLTNLTAIKGNRLYLFYSQYLFEENGDKTILEADHTTLAQALKQCGVSYRTVDYTKNESLLYIRMEKALVSRRDDFDAEGNLDMYEQKLKETIMGKQLSEKKRVGRYLYICEN